MKMLVLACLMLVTFTGYSQHLKLHFLYGSKPARGFKDTESKHFGGIKGGHVNIELNGRVLDFLPGNCPILPENKNPTGGFRLNSSIYWDTANTKWLTIIIPISADKEKQLEKLFEELSQKTPYDYAVFGMRCAAASYDVLSEIGLVKKLSNSNNVIRNFYPKLLRKRMLKWAEKNNYTVISHEGKESRKWESDKGIF